MGATADREQPSGSPLPAGPIPRPAAARRPQAGWAGSFTKVNEVTNETKKLTVLIDENSDECLYVDGIAWSATGERTVYVCDLVEMSLGMPIELKQVSVVRGEKRWPERLDDGLLLAQED